jgi:hypothetical protein
MKKYSIGLIGLTLALLLSSIASATIVSCFVTDNNQSIISQTNPDEIVFFTVIYEYPKVGILKWTLNTVFASTDPLLKLSAKYTGQYRIEVPGSNQITIPVAIPLKLNLEGIATLNFRSKAGNCTTTLTVLNQSDPPILPIPPIDVSGTWTGSWKSSVFAQQGPIHGTLERIDSTHFRGTFIISGSRCFGLTNVTGIMDNGSITFGAAGEWDVANFYGTYTSTTIKGNYAATEGDCMGDYGTFSVKRD